MLESFNSTRMIPLGTGMFTVGTAIIGLVLLMTSIILYTMSKLLNRQSVIGEFSIFSYNLLMSRI